MAPCSHSPSFRRGCSPRPPARRRHPQTQDLPIACDAPAQDEADGIIRLACNKAERPRHLENPRHRLGGPGIFEALSVKRGQNVGVRIARRNNLQVLWGAHRRPLK